MKSQSNSGKLRVCVVGAGRMGADHIERLTRRIVGAEVSQQWLTQTFREQKGRRRDSLSRRGFRYRTGSGPGGCQLSPNCHPWFSTETCCFRFWSTMWRFCVRNH